MPLPFPRGGRRVLVVLVGLLVAALAVTFVAVGTAGTDPAAAPKGSTKATGPARAPASSGQVSAAKGERDGAIAAALERRAKAVLARDRQAFLADIDTSNEEFLASQEQLFDNLTKVRFADFRYETIGREYDWPELREKYGPHHHVSALLLHYQIRGYDRAPVARPHALTFVRRDGDWVITSDTDADRELPETGHADPWDRRPIVVREGKHVLLIGDEADKGRLGRVVRAADEAVRRTALVWPDRWRRKVVVVAVNDPRVLETYFRAPEQTSDNVAAIAVPAFDAVDGWSPDDAMAAELRYPVRSRVILNPEYFDPRDERNRDLLTHEVTHVATQQDNWAGAPTWLVEGAAEYTAYRHLRPFSVDLPKSLSRQVASGSVELPTYDFYSRNVSANYLAGFLACAWIAENYGEDTLRDVMRRLGRTPNEGQTIERTRKVLRKRLGVSQRQFQRDVAAFGARVGSR